MIATTETREQRAAVLRALRDRPGLTPHDLAHATGYDPSDVDGLVAWLARRELVEIRSCPARQVYPA